MFTWTIVISKAKVARGRDIIKSEGKVDITLVSYGLLDQRILVFDKTLFKSRHVKLSRYISHVFVSTVE